MPSRSRNTIVFSDAETGRVVGGRKLLGGGSGCEEMGLGREQRPYWLKTWDYVPAIKTAREAPYTDNRVMVVVVCQSVQDGVWTCGSVS